MLALRRLRGCRTRDSVCRCLEPVPAQYPDSQRDTVEAEEERLRARARALPDRERAAFHREATRALRDPDTYGVLNWFLVVGLHHFYLVQAWNNRRLRRLLERYERRAGGPG